jgi:hypothetical protein
MTLTNVSGREGLYTLKGDSLSKDKYPVDIINSPNLIPHIMNGCHSYGITAQPAQEHTHSSTIDFYLTDAFSAISFCFSGFKNDSDV